MTRRTGSLENEKTSRAVEDYLITIYRVLEAYGEARTTVIARELGVTPATISKVLSKLVERGLVRWAKYRGAELTEEGRKIAERIIRKHRIIEVWLKKYLNYSNFEVHRLAHLMEHLPDELIERIYINIGRPAVCPHGNPIPGATPDVLIEGAKPLIEFGSGSRVRIVRVAGELVSVLSIMEKLGIDVGYELYVIENNRGFIKAKIFTGDEVSLPPYAAKAMVVIQIQRRRGLA
ncbi:MAG: metal-dependent transcriptional regulator [Desulfurococcales archaeon]|nr:metal-dependent transcriptional regulator [Desulfurococcales archaeon]